MSAIAGIWRFEGQPVTALEIQCMHDVLACRGADGLTAWAGGAVAMVHCLSITTPEAREETLPLQSPASAMVITADARLDNRDELMLSLGWPERPWSGIGDGQLILAAYERWGTECPRHLLGDFAFAIWDPRRQSLFCARDAMGIKPLYYYHDSRLFAFASELKALLCTAEVPRSLNESKLLEYVVAISEDREATFYEHVLRLPPAHALLVNRRGKQLLRYWALDPSRELRLRSDHEYAEAFRERFTRAVTRRLRSVFPVGAALSGGLDSSSIACVARDALAESTRHLHTFSAVFPRLAHNGIRSIDERRYLEAVLASGSFCAHFCQADTLSPLADLDDFLTHADQPFLAPNLYMHWGLYQAAQEQGVRVFLDGVDGDTTVSHGLGYLADLARRGRWLRLGREAAALARRSPARFTTGRILWEFGVRPTLPDTAVRLRSRLRPGSACVDTVIAPAFARRAGLEELLEQSRQGRHTHGSARQQHVCSLQSGLLTEVLELADACAGAWNIEPRYPFFDRELVEFCVALPGSQQLSQGWTRAVFRRAMEGVLPAAVQWRFSKADLGSCFTLRMWERDREVLEDVVYGDPQSIAPYIDLDKLRSAYRRYAAGPMREQRDALTIHRTAVLARWLRRKPFTAAGRPATAVYGRLL